MSVCILRVFLFVALGDGQASCSLEGLVLFEKYIFFHTGSLIILFGF
jgi:hypothetical protein